MKYDFVFKMKVVQEYLNANSGSEFLSKKYNISSHKSLLMWNYAYNEFGSEGLMRKLQNKKRESSTASEDHSN